MVIFYGPKEKPEAQEFDQKSPEAMTRWGHALPPRRVPLPSRCLVDPLNMRLMPKIPINTKTPKNKPRSGVPPPQASVSMKNQLGSRSATLPDGETITSGHVHHSGGLHDEEGVVHPRGRGYVPIAMCLISLSLVFLIWHDLDVP